MHRRQTHTIKLSSSTDLGATNRTDDGSSFTVDLSRSLMIPTKAMNVRLHVQSALISNSSPNVWEEESYNMRFVDRRQRVGSTPTGANPLANVARELVRDTDGNFVPETDPALWTTVTVTPREGLYNISEIGDAIINDVLIRTFGSSEFATAVVIRGQVSTGLATIAMGIPHTTLELSPDMRQLLGFNDGQPSIFIGPINNTAIGATSRYIGQNVVNLQPSPYYYIQCDLVDQGMQVPTPNNNGGQDIIARVPINVGAGELVHFEPVLPPDFACARLRDQTTSETRLTLLDDQLRHVHTGGKDWSVTITISYITSLR